MSLFFITGQIRSGTTLLGKLLGALPGVAGFDQPFPLLYVMLKRNYLKTRNAPPGYIRYPLGDWTFERQYDWQDFLGWLQEFQITRDFAKDVLNEMKDYPGQMYRPDLSDETLARITPANLKDFVTRALETGTGNGNKISAVKEVFCEEFIPYFLKQGTPCGYIVRDPRDVYVSLTQGGYKKHAGVARPILWFARNWRASVRFALSQRENPRFHFIRFEDLVRDKEATARAIVKFLGMQSRQETFSQNLEKELNQNWQGNSSFDHSVGNGPIGRYKKDLDTDSLQLIEALCRPEMVSVGYDTSIKAEHRRMIIENVIHQETLQRPELEYYLWTKDRRAEEISRLDHETGG